MRNIYCTFDKDGTIRYIGVDYAEYRVSNFIEEMLKTPNLYFVINYNTEEKTCQLAERVTEEEIK